MLAWIVAALAASALLAGVILWEHKYARTRWGSFLVGDPHLGSHLFTDKGCAHCHAVNGDGGHLAPDLGFHQPPYANLNHLVIAMWNHSPKMWERMREDKLSYPDLDYEEMAHLFAYLYIVRYVDEPGDVERGRRLFETKGCIGCHALYGKGGTAGPDLSRVGGVDTPVVWAQTMWNHAPAMEAQMKRQGMDWPSFQGSEMNDLLAYVREVCGGPRREFALLPANPDRGSKLFQTKSCIACHSVKGEGGHVGPELGPTHQLPVTMIQFAGLMWNHSPQMWREMQARGIPRPTFTGREMADLITFLHSIRYFEAGGSPQVGEILFARRGCSNCHGARAEGTSTGPALRGQGGTFTGVTLATALWHHGPDMYQRTRTLGLPWPKLAESDVGDLAAFLNTPPNENRQPVQTPSSPGKQ